MTWRIDIKLGEILLFRLHPDYTPFYLWGLVTFILLVVYLWKDWQFKHWMRTVIVRLENPMVLSMKHYNILKTISERRGQTLKASIEEALEIWAETLGQAYI